MSVKSLHVQTVETGNLQTLHNVSKLLLTSTFSDVYIEPELRPG